VFGRSTLLLVVAAACGESGGSSPSPDAAPGSPGDTVELAPFAGWPEQVLVRRTGEPSPGRWPRGPAGRFTSRAATTTCRWTPTARSRTARASSSLSPDLAKRTVVNLPGPRDVQLRALRLAPDGRMFFAGMRNGPLTHTDPALLHNEGVLGATRIDPP
jgi:hypothetical protein